MGKRIVLCFDGTWNTPGNHGDLEAVVENQAKRPDRSFERPDPAAGPETNVCRIYRSILSGTGSSGTVQQKWYDKGVGTDWYDRAAGGAFGLGLSRKIREGYKRLSDTYDPGDDVFIFGFSRGAYTARSLVGFIRNCGLLPKGSLSAPDPDANTLLMEAYEIYRARDSGADSERAQDFRRKNDSRLIPIRFLGVWDTVGALGIPIESFVQFNKEQFQFHDTELSGIVANAFHAIAVDENREPYAVTLWDPKEKPKQVVEQRWFVGAHADVGGGYPDRQLSDITLAWMQAKAASCGLELDSAGVPAVVPENRTAPLTDSFHAFLGGLFALFHTRYWRPVCMEKFGSEMVDDEVRLRLEDDAAYRPKNAGLREAIAATPGSAA